MKKIFFTALLLVLVLSGCSSNNQANRTDKKDAKVELTISAAASLQDSLNDIKASFEKAHPNVQINYNFGASGALQQQISQGAPVDLFFSAAEDKFNLLVQKGDIEKKNSINLVGNDLVLVVPKDNSKGINNFKDVSRAENISVGTPESVPAGKYAQETFEALNIWNSLQGKVVYAKDVRQVLTYVETGNVDAGVVYKTDALTSKKVKIAATAEDNTHTPIIYPVGVVKETAHPKEAELFLEYLQNQTSIDIFKKYGFKNIH